MSDNARRAGDQQGSRLKPKWFWIDPSETTRRASLFNIYRAYLQGALHDGTYNKYHRTFRFVQKEREWLERLQSLFSILGIKSWIYREGKMRSLFALETSAPFLKIYFDPKFLKTDGEKIAYIRGYFDAEGGIPHNGKFFYLQFAQKNFPDITALHFIVRELGIDCGIIHNPSITKDPHYWRFYILRNSHQKFLELIGSWHPRKAQIIQQRMMI